MMTKRVAAALIVTATILSACGGWTRPNTTEAEFRQDRYACEREALSMYPVAMVRPAAVYQQPTYTDCISDGYQVNCTTSRQPEYQGVPIDSNAGARSRAANSCLEARGYVYARAQQSQAGQPNSQLKSAIAEADQEFLRICGKQEFKPYFAKTACQSREITLDQLADEARITADEKVALLNVRKESSALSRRLIDAFRRLGGAKGFEVATLRERLEQTANDYSLDLYNGKITWGEYNKKRQETGFRYREEFSRIVRQK